jgi:vacuolar protein sorting-associated protein 26
MFLNGISDLSPTMIKINNKFSVNYFLQVVLIDEMNRKYFKQNEIKLYRENS